jgi:hypothetical protein
VFVGFVAAPTFTVTIETFLVGPSSGSFAPLVGTLGFADESHERRQL